MSVLSILGVQQHPRVGLFAVVRQVGCYLIEVFCCLSGRWFQYERNEPSVSLVYQLSDKASLGSYAL